MQGNRTYETPSVKLNQIHTCLIWNQGSAIVGAAVYSGMGKYTFSPYDASDPGEQFDTIFLTNLLDFYSPGFSIDFSSTSNTLADFPDGISQFPYQSTHGILMSTNTSLYFLNSDEGVYVYDILNNKGEFDVVPMNHSHPAGSSKGGYASDPVTGRMFYAGTYDGTTEEMDNKGRGWLEILETDHRTPKETSGENITPRWVNRVDNGPSLVGSALNYLRYGKQGVLVAFGGSDYNVTTNSYNEYMNNIKVFDIDSSKWYTVQATGGSSEKDIPPSGQIFYSGVSAAPDDSSFQITIYYQGRVFVLTIPTFQWLDVTPGDQSNGDGNGNPGRELGTAVVWNEAQMIIVGGLVKNGANSTRNGCSSGSPYLFLDLTVFEWKTAQEFNFDQAYTQPKYVYSLIGGDYSGGNKQKGPPGGFNNSSLDSIFATTLPKVPANLTDISLEGIFPKINVTPKKSKIPIIVGATVGGVVGVMLILGIIWYFWWRRRGQQIPEVPKATVLELE
ncbi:hypothetical protein TWF694_007299 [Orbilia ellipsospora]|uniref:Uncharacterized protein n=1 Tax=Orbilia ellipsospora TaxID=2528407 RepID=A0AAV9XHB2_9PEZI